MGSEEKKPTGRRWRMALLGALVAGVLLTGCGGSSSPAPISKAVFLKEGNAVCKQIGSERDAALTSAAKETGGSSPSSEMSEFVSSGLAPVVSQMTEELEGLGEPKHYERQARSLIESFEGAVQQLEAEPSTLMAGDPFAAANKKARELGLPECRI